MNILTFLYLSYWWPSGSFLFLAFKNKAVVNILLHIFSFMHVLCSLLLVIYLRLKSWVNYKLSFSKNAMAPHSGTLAWKIPWMEEPSGLQSMGSLRVEHDWATSLSLCTLMHWRRKWQPTPVFLPEESQGWGSLVGCRLWGRTESDTTEVT